MRINNYLTFNTYNIIFCNSRCTTVDNYIYLPSYTHTHTHTHIYIYIYTCVWLCVCFRLRVVRPNDRGSIPNRSKKFTFFLKSFHLLWGQPVIYSVGTGVSVIVVTERGAWGRQLAPPRSAWVKNEWSSISTSTYIFMACRWARAFYYIIIIIVIICKCL